MQINDKVEVVYDKIHNGGGFTHNRGVIVDISDIGNLPYGVLLDGYEVDGPYYFEAEEIEVIQ